MQAGPKATVLRTPCHGCTGCGAFHLRSPTGGAAKGTPLNTPMPLTASPWTVPAVVLASVMAACAGTAATSASTAQKALIIAPLDFLNFEAGLWLFPGPYARPKCAR
jgi:hypothetical protein